MDINKKITLKDVDKMALLFKAMIKFLNDLNEIDSAIEPNHIFNCLLHGIFDYAEHHKIEKKYFVESLQIMLNHYSSEE